MEICTGVHSGFFLKKFLLLLLFHIMKKMHDLTAISFSKLLQTFFFMW